MAPLYAFDEDTRRMLIKLHLEDRGGKASGPVEGAYGEIYSIEFPENTHPRRIAAKCPRIRRFGSPEQARAGVEHVLYELEKTHQIHAVPWVNRFADVRIIHGWPFVVSRYRDGTLEDLIANPLMWSVRDRFASLIQITRALRMAADRGIAAHQDLKPANIFFDDLRRNLPGLTDSEGIHFHIFVGDFGVANAFKDLGKNTGSRPYMAPEQFANEPLEPDNVRFDVFALGVIAFECFTNGLHPSGIVTADVWPWNQGQPQKWNRASTWHEWAAAPDKSRQVEAGHLPARLSKLVLSSLSAEPSARPTLQEFEEGLWNSLIQFDENAHIVLRMQIDHVEGLSSGDDHWPHMDERLNQLRHFYSDL